MNSPIIISAISWEWLETRLALAEVIDFRNDLYEKTKTIKRHS